MSLSTPFPPASAGGATDPETQKLIAAVTDLKVQVTLMNSTLERLIRVIDGEEKTDNPGLRAIVRKHETLYQTVDRLEFTMRVGGSLLGIIGLGNLIDLILRFVLQAQGK